MEMLLELLGSLLWDLVRALFVQLLIIKIREWWAGFRHPALKNHFTT
jgi:hypothetical protein